MNDQKMYVYLFNQITDALQAMDKQNYGNAKDILKIAQQRTEEMFIDFRETN